MCKCKKKYRPVKEKEHNNNRPKSLKIDYIFLMASPGIVCLTNDVWVFYIKTTLHFCNPCWKRVSRLLFTIIVHPLSYLDYCLVVEKTGALGQM